MSAQIYKPSLGTSKIGMLSILLQAWMPTEAARDQVSAFAREAI
jgi:hypothetical protein